jgi:chromosome partitioning protein
MIYATCSVKGGSGKTTTAVYLAEALSRVSHHVCLVDADPQGSCLTWADSAAESGMPLSVDVEGLPSAVLLRRRLPALAANYDTVIIDCPNRDTQIIETAINASSLLIIPCPPGVEELRRARTALSWAQKMGKPAHLLCTMYTRTTLAREVTEVIDADDTLSRFDTLIRRRADIASTVGMTRPNDLHDYDLFATELMKEETK